MAVEVAEDEVTVELLGMDVDVEELTVDRVGAMSGHSAAGLHSNMVDKVIKQT